MPSRSRAEWIAIVLLLVEGLSGTSVGVTLLAAVARVAGVDAAIEIPAVLVLYGIALIVSAAGILLGREWGWWLALGHLVTALLLAVTIVGIPLAWAHLKLAGLALWPIGKVIVPA